ncbi:MAG: hypothetical protein ACRDRH_16050 [Pseudonocardia sp.]
MTPTPVDDADRADEPLFEVPQPFYLRPRFLRPFIPAFALTVVGLVALLVSGLLVPSEPVVTLEGKMGVNADFFDDEQVQEILLRNRLRVHVTRMGSIEAVTTNLDSTDFVFPSGQHAVELFTQRLVDEGRLLPTSLRPFVSSIVLATYRDYAKTLEERGLAEPQPGQGVDPLYYDLDIKAFIDLGLFDTKTSWNQLRAGRPGLDNGNQVLAQTTDMCTSNGGGAYLALAAFVVGGAPTTDQEMVALVDKIAPLLRAQGQPVSNPEIYFNEEGRRTASIIVLYEHQYLAHQLRHRLDRRELDTDRVLLYPDRGLQTGPEFVPLTEDGARLGRLIVTDPDLRERATQLGFRVLDSSDGELSRFLAERGVPVPYSDTETKVILPRADLLGKMIKAVDECRGVG